MLLLLFLLYALRSATNAAPVSVIVDGLDLASQNQSICPDQQRSIWDIIWSCLATIFACSWVSVHPNVTPPRKTWWNAPLERLELMFWAIVAPEVIILWAMRQWFGARKLAKEYFGMGWTKTHGYFIQMGGLTWLEGDESRGFLDPDIMRVLLQEGRIEFPTITEDEIRDRSKGDALSKALAIGQTSWFVIQCLARRAEGLDLTELELVTAALAVLNGVMYFLWWNKPLDVQCSVPVQTLDIPTKPFDFEKSMCPPDNTVIFETFATNARNLFLGIGPQFLSCWRTTKSIDTLSIITEIIKSPWTIISAMFSRLLDIVEVSQPSTFYAYSDKEHENLAVVWASIVAVIFGAIHCAGWAFIFPTHAELILWRVSAITTTVIPFFMGCGVAMGMQVESESILGTLAGLMAIPAMLSIPFYVVARLLLFSDAFVTLRHLQPSAYQAIEWVTLLPHI